MDWRRAGSPTYGRRRAAGGIYSAPASPAHPLGPATAAAAASPVHPLAARSKARAAAAMARQQGARGHDDGGGDEYDGFDDAGEANGNGTVYGGGRSPLRGGAAAAGGGAVKDKRYFGFALPKVLTHR